MRYLEFGCGTNTFRITLPPGASWQYCSRQSEYTFIKNNNQSERLYKQTVADGELGRDEVSLVYRRSGDKSPCTDACTHFRQFNEKRLAKQTHPKKVHRRLQNNKSLARKEILHKSRVQRPNSARCAVNLVCSCQVPVITHMQLRLQKSTPSLHPTNLGRWQLWENCLGQNTSSHILIATGFSVSL